MSDNTTKTDKRTAKRRKARYGMTVSGKSAKLHHALSLRRGLSKRVQKALQRAKSKKSRSKLSPNA